MDPYERTHLCDGLKDLKVKAGDYVIKEVSIYLLLFK